MRTCSCGHSFNSSKVPSLGKAMGLNFFNCPKCNSTLCEILPEKPILMATIKALRIKATIEELEKYLENERKAG